MTVYTRDPNRILIDTNIGNVQAWSAPASDVAIAVSFYAGIKHGPSKASYIAQTLNLTVEDARDIARALIEAADHANSVQPVVEAADLGIAA